MAAVPSAEHRGPAPVLGMTATFLLASNRPFLPLA
jgi:hypothetical protein